MVKSISNSADQNAFEFVNIFFFSYLDLLAEFINYGLQYGTRLSVLLVSYRH
jgi:hypothetical protein